jgi:Tfp pilus assembly protein PilF
VIRKIVPGGVAATVGALAFAVHPVQAEAVNWASSFYTVFSGALGVAAIWLYLEHRDRVKRAEKTAWRWAAVATVAYAAAVCAKPSLVILPIIAGAIEVIVRGARVREVVWLLGAWVAMAVPMSLVTVGVQEGQYRGEVAMWERPLVAGDAAGWYLRKVVWPWPMGIDYGRSPECIRHEGSFWWAWVGPAFIAAGAWVWRRRVPLATGALVVFVAGALPFLGLMTFGFQRYSTVADRYIYMGMLGVAIAVAGVVRRWPGSAVVAGAVCGVWVAGSVIQSRHWRATKPLMEQAVAVNPTSRAGHDVLAFVATEEGNDPEAVAHYSATLRAFPSDELANYNLGNLAMSRGDLAAAIGYFQKALDERGGDANIRMNLGVALARSGQADAAEREFREATRMAPNWAPGWTNLGAILAAKGQDDDARRAYERALEADPNYALARSGLRKLEAAR